MNLNFELIEYRDEIVRLERMAKKLKELGMSEKANGYKAEIGRLNLRLDKLELEFYRETNDEH